MERNQKGLSHVLHLSHSNHWGAMDLNPKVVQWSCTVSNSRTLRLDWEVSRHVWMTVTWDRNLGLVWTFLRKRHPWQPWNISADKLIILVYMDKSRVEETFYWRSQNKILWLIYFELVFSNLNCLLRLCLNFKSRATFTLRHYFKDCVIFVWMK